MLASDNLVEHLGKFFPLESSKSAPKRAQEGVRAPGSCMKTHLAPKGTPPHLHYYYTPRRKEVVIYTWGRVFWGSITWPCCLWELKVIAEDGWQRCSCFQCFQELLRKVKCKDCEKDGSVLVCPVNSTRRNWLCKLSNSIFFHQWGTFTNFRTAIIISKNTDVMKFIVLPFEAGKSRYQMLKSFSYTIKED